MKLLIEKPLEVAIKYHLFRLPRSNSTPSASFHAPALSEEPKHRSRPVRRARTANSSPATVLTRGTAEAAGLTDTRRYWCRILFCGLVCVVLDFFTEFREYFYSSSEMFISYILFIQDSKQLGKR